MAPTLPGVTPSGALGGTKVALGAAGPGGVAGSSRGLSPSSVPTAHNAGASATCHRPNPVADNGCCSGMPAPANRRPSGGLQGQPGGPKRVHPGQVVPQSPGHNPGPAPPSGERSSLVQPRPVCVVQPWSCSSPECVMCVVQPWSCVILVITNSLVPSALCYYACTGNKDRKGKSLVP